MVVLDEVLNPEEVIVSIPFVEEPLSTALIDEIKSELGLPTTAEVDVQHLGGQKYRIRQTFKPVYSTIASSDQLVILQQEIQRLKLENSRLKRQLNGKTLELPSHNHCLSKPMLDVPIFPLHHQDWACPNREGILLAIGGRLLVLAQSSQAQQVLQKSLDVGKDFLQKVDEAEQGRRNKPVPPRVTPHRPPPKR